MRKIEVPGEESRVPKFAIVIIILLVAGIVVLVILMGLQQPSSTQAGYVEFGTVTEELIPDEDFVINFNNATLYVPRAAIQLAGSITIFPREPNLFSNAGEPGWSRPLVIEIEYRDEAGNPYAKVTFSMPIQICFKVTQERWLDYLNRQDAYQVQHYADERDPPRWEPLPMLMFPDRNELCGETDHLSIFALAIKE